MKILLVDDHIIIRQGLKHFIESASDPAAYVDTCASSETLKLVQSHSYDVVLMSFTLSNVDPIELIKQIKADKPKMALLVLSSLDEEQYSSRLLRAGVSGILTKNSASAELAEALDRVSRGRKYISPSLAETMIDIPADAKMSLPDVLSDREYEVMVSLVSGRRTKQIADDMSLSVKTVSTYHSRILMKLKLENDAQLIRYAIEHGIIRDSLIARQKLFVSEFNIRTAPLIHTVREIWHQRKAVIIVIGILAIIAYVVLTYLIRFVF
jgi:two-component system invasion response regulator UvrY